MSTIVREWLSDIELQDPGDYYGGFKRADVVRFGDGERALSHLRTGEWSGSTFTLTIADDRRYREQLASPIDRYWSEPLTVRIVDRATRAVKGVPYVVFVGTIIDVTFTPPLGLELQLGDVVSQGLLADSAMAPWRRIGDGLIDQLSTVASGLDLDLPEPIIYGINKRLPTDAPTGDGLVYSPSYLGTMSVSGTDYHVWLVAGHACADLPDLYVDYVSKIANEGSDWLVPHHAGWTALMGANPFVDYRSSVYGNDRRYTLVLGKVGNADPDACADGSKALSLWVDGVEPVGDGSGAVITKRLLQYKHFAINFIANQGQASYQSGPWLTTPTWSLFDATVDIVNEPSWDACDAIAFERFPTDSGYTGAGVIGATAGDRASLKKWIADWNRSCNCRFGITHLGQLRVVMLHPTEAIKVAAPLFEEANDILLRSFQPTLLLSEHANNIPFVADYNHVTGQWMTAMAARDDESILNYGRVINGETREYPFAPGTTNAYQIALMELLVSRVPPRIVTLETTLGALTTLDLGDYIRYRHFGSVGDARGQIRLAQIQRHQVQAGSRRVLVEALDCEDLIGFDMPVVADDPAPTNVTCADALEVTIDEDGNAVYTFDTTDSPIDTSVGSPLLPGPGIANHPNWLKFTAPADGNLAIETTTSAYDTVLAVLEGTCGGSWTLLASNDNYGPVSTSKLNLDLTSGQEVYILTFGYDADDGGYLRVGITFAEEP